MTSPEIDQSHPPEHSGAAVEEKAWHALAALPDPETGVGMVAMGLVYGVEFSPDSRRITVRMTLTTPACPMSGALQDGVRRAVSALPEVEEVRVELVFDPPWTPARVSEEGRRQLGW
ncbi:MAG: metal-sulfur cluster assembly factor [Planctomycetota bacterium]|nr:MAG: metal-sulfur cluster assembly factor [Planctomycetota bacterium]